MGKLGSLYSNELDIEGPSKVLKDVRAKNFYNTDFFHTLATVR